jgi:hypothetical protein
MSSGNSFTPVMAASTTEGRIYDENRMIRWIEIGVYASLMLALIFLHVTVFMHSGGLWRDEVSCFNISNLPSFSDIWDTTQFDSLPILWFLTLRTWINFGFGETDLALRALGLIIGLGTLGTLWLVGQHLAMRLPLLSLVLFSFCPTAFFCDSLRAFGLGVILILLSMGYMWRAIQDPIPWKMTVSLVSAILSVQCLFHNAFLLFAICMGAVAVGIHRRQWKLIAFPLVVGAIAALSLLPYYAIVLKVSDWNILFKVPVTLSWILHKFVHAIDPSGLFLPALIWLLLASYVIVRFSRKQLGEQRDLTLFLWVTMLVSIISYITFLKILSYTTRDWYYLPLMAVLAIIIDKGVDAACERVTTARIARVACVLGISVFIFMNSWNAAHIRRTNIDILAAKLESISSKNDLIVVFPFYYGISFARYYKGSSEWVTLPDINDHRVHRYDLIKDRMIQRVPIKSILENMVQTLKDGNRVWLVGGLSFLRQGETRGNIAPPLNSPYGLSEHYYEMIWSRQAADALQKHGQTIEQILMPTIDPVNAFENVPLLMVQGWRP